MRKLVCLLVVMFMAAPVLADDPCSIITITGSSTVESQLNLYYNVSAVSVDTPVGISLTLTCDGDGAINGDPCILYVDPCFPVYLDYAHDQIPGGWEPCDWNPASPLYEFDPPEGSPLADADVAGQPSGAVQEFALCMGRLVEGDDPVQKAVTRLLATIKLEGTDSTNVVVASDALRGGTVGSPFTVNIDIAPGGVEVALPAGGPDPSCWNACSGQPLGDADCNGAVNLDDLDLFKAAIFTAPGSGAWNQCADFNHTCSVNLDDLDIFKANIFTGGYTSGGPVPGADECP